MSAILTSVSGGAMLWGAPMSLTPLPVSTLYWSMKRRDLGAEGLDFAWALLKPGRDHFVVALDGAQRIYRGKRRWNPPNLTAQGRTTVLRVNYRNTRQILDAALTALDDAARRSDGDEQSDDLDVLVTPEQAIRPGNNMPTLIAGDGLRAEADAIVAEVERLRTHGVPSHEMAVLSGWKELREALLGRIRDSFEVKGRARDAVATAVDSVPIATLQMLKGLEYRHVIIGGANDIWVPEDDPEEQNRQRRRLLYVAMTRASETLTVTYSGDGIMNTFSQVPQLN